MGLGLGVLFSTFATLIAQAAGPLPNGVAAGDTTSTTVVLWARATVVGQVLFEYSTDQTFNTGVLSATTTATNVMQSAKVEITGLSPATTYHYRVTDAAMASGQGKFRTSAQTGTQDGLRFGVSGDWEGSLAPYPSISNADDRNLDFFIEHGDTIAAGTTITTVEDYRLKHDEVYSTHLALNTWADLRGSTSIYATIDDNDVRDNFAGGAHPSTDSEFAPFSGAFINETELYDNALQAFQEFNPLRNEFYGATGDSRTANKRKLYRYNTYGSDAAIIILDSRSFRDEQLPALTDPTDTAAGLQFMTDSLSDTTRTLLGAKQLSDLKADLQQAQAAGITWKFVLIPSAIQNLGPFKAEDRYEGYGAERTDLLRFITQNGIDNVVFIAAGLHGTIVNNLTYQELPAQLPLTDPLNLIHTQTGAFEVIVGPVAIDPPAGPFGPVIVQLALDYGLITALEKALYDLASRPLKDAALKQVIDEEILTELGYDLIGLNGSGIDATLIEGDYLAAHTYGWTEFEIDSGTQALTVTTYGIDYYTEADLNDDPDDVVDRTPEIVSQFVVNPIPVTASQKVYLPIVVKND